MILIFILNINTTCLSQNSLYITYSTGKYGVIDTSLTQILPEIYDKIEIFDSHFISAQKDTFFLLFDAGGKQIGTKKYDSLLFDKSKLIITKKNNLYGIINLDQTCLLNEKYEEIKTFDEKTIRLKLESKYCLCFIKTAAFTEYFDSISNPARHIYFCKKDSKTLLLDSENLFQSAFFKNIEKKNPTLYFLSTPDTVYIYDMRAKAKIEELASNYYYEDNYLYAYKTKNRLNIHRISDHAAAEIEADSINKSFDIQNKTGGISSFLNKEDDKQFWIFYLNGKCGLTDQNLKIILPADYDLINQKDDDIQIWKNSKTGLSDKNGHEKLPLIYNDFIDQGDYYYIIKNNRYGIFQNGKERIPPIYERLFQHTPEHFSFLKNGQFGLINRNGKVLIQAQYDEILHGIKSLVFRKKNQYGIADFSGKTLVDAQFDNISVLNSDYYRVGKSKKYGIVRFDGQGVAKPAYFSIKSTECPTIFSVEGFCYKNVLVRGLNETQKIHVVGYINSFGEILLDTLFYPEKIDTDFSAGYLKAAQDSGVLIVSFDVKGKLIEKTKYANYVFIKKAPLSSKKNVWLKKDELWGLYTYDNKQIIPNSFMQIEQNFLQTDSKTLVTEISEFDNNKKIGIVDDKTGKFVLTPDFDFILNEDFKWASVARCVNLGRNFRLITKNATAKGDFYTYIGEFKNGFARFCLGGNIIYKKIPKYSLEIPIANEFLNKQFENYGRRNNKHCDVVITEGKWGVMDSEGAHSIEAQYDFLQEFDSGIFLAEKKGKWGGISASGAVNIDFKFDELRYIVENTDSQTWAKIPFYKARINNRWGVIDSAGNLIIQPEFSDILVKENGKKRYFITVRQSKEVLCGVVNSAGKIILFPTFPVIGNYSEGVAAVKSFKSRWGFIDSGGKMIVDTVYREVRNFHEDFAAVKTDAGWNFIDKNNQLLLSNSVLRAGDFSGGLAPVRLIIKKRTFPFGTKFYQLEGFINTKGEIDINPKFSQVEEFVGSSAIVVQNRKFGMIGRNGQFTVKPNYVSIERNTKTGNYGAVGLDGNLYLMVKNDNNFVKIDSMINLEGFSSFFISKFEKKFNVDIPLNDEKTVDNQTTENQFKKLVFSEGKAVYRASKLYGLYDISGKQIAETKYFEISWENHGIFGLKSISETFYIKPN